MSPLVSSVASIRTSVPVQTRSLSTLLITCMYLLRAVLLIKAASIKDGKVPKTPGPPSLPPVGAMHTFSTYMYLRSGSAQGNGNVKYLCFFWGVGRKGYHLLYLASSTT